MFFKKRKIVQKQKIGDGSLVKIKEQLKDDKSYYIVLNQINENNKITEKDYFDDSGSVGIVWGLTEDDIIDKEIHLRLWNHELKKFIIIAEKYLEKINE